jgi:hypothetical protein
MTMLSQTVEATTEVELSPALKTQLIMELSIYAGLEQQRNELQAEMDGMAEAIERLRLTAGAKSLSIEGGYHVTRVEGGTSKSLNKKKVYALGIMPHEFALCYTEKPKRGYTLITTPNSKKRKDSDEAP